VTTPNKIAGIPSATKSQRQPLIPSQWWLMIHPAIGDPITNEIGIAAMKLLVAFARSVV
jgi:hypothetical protein